MENTAADITIDEIIDHLAETEMMLYYKRIREEDPGKKARLASAHTAVVQAIRYYKDFLDCTQ